MRSAPAVTVVATVFAVVAAAQVPLPESRTWEPRRFHEVERRPEVESPVVARADWDEDSVIVYADGSATYAVRRAGQLFLEFWAARLPPERVDRVAEAAATARAKGTRLSLGELRFLVRLPLAARQGLNGRSLNWLEQHQEEDGSWSPADFDWNCVGDEGCAGKGEESFRIATTALLFTAQLNAGSQIVGEGAARPARDYLRSRQLPDGGFAAASDPHAAMTNACGALALCRAFNVGKVQGGFTLIGRIARLAIGRITADQLPDGSWGSESDEMRKVSTAVWNLMALRAAATAGMEVDPAFAARGLSWVEKTVASIAARADGATSRLDLTRARACRAMARAACAASEQQIGVDVAWLARELDLDGPAVHDAEVLFFGSLAARACEHVLWRTWATKCEVALAAGKARGACARDSWTMRSVWGDLGGRPFSTALMTWTEQVHVTARYWGRRRPGSTAWALLTAE